MRIISGIAKGRKLSSFRGSEIRPTSDRARESLFNILGQRSVHSSFLDLFAGSGAVGIEALSRHADHVVFVENQATSISLLKNNLKKCGFSERVNQNIKIIKKDVFDYLKKARKQFDIIFIDPPYSAGLAEKSLISLSEKSLLKPEGIVVLEHYFKNTIEEEISSLKCFRRKKIGDSFFSFFTPLRIENKKGTKRS